MEELKLEEQRKKKRPKRKSITLEKITDEYLQKLRRDKDLQGFGKSILIVKVRGQTPSKEVFSEDRWIAVEKAITAKQENPDAIVKLVVY